MGPMEKRLVAKLYDEKKWLASMAGKCPRQSEMDRVENLCIGCMLILQDKIGGFVNYRSWFARNKFVSAFADRKRTAFTKKWNKRFLSLVDLTISELSARPDHFANVAHIPIDLIDNPRTKAQQQAFAKARKLRHQKTAGEREMWDDLQRRRALIQELRSNVKLTL